VESRLWRGLGQVLRRRHDGRLATAYTYRRELQPLLVIGLALVLVEGIVVEVVLAILLAGTPWPWLLLVAHLYGVCWLAGLLASLCARPHLLTQDAVVLRDSVFGELTVPWPAIGGASRANQPGFARSGIKLDAATGIATVTHGTATVNLILRPAPPIAVNGVLVAQQPRSVLCTVDDVAGFLAAVRGRIDTVAG
jgi:hypothetical protein